MGKKKTTKRKRAPKRQKKTPQLTAETVFNHLSLRIVRLLSLNSSIVIKDGKMPAQAQMTIGLGYGFGDDRSSIHVQMNLEAEAKPSESSGSDSTLIKIHATFQAVYSIAGAIEPENFAEHGQVIAADGSRILWPYMRELVQSISGRMGVPPITMPVYLGDINVIQAD